MTAERPDLEQLQHATVEILRDGLGFPEVSLDVTLADLDLDSLSMAELLAELEARHDLPEITLTNRDPRLKLGELIELIHSGMSRENRSTSR